MFNITKNWEIIKKYIIKIDFIGPEYFLENNDSSRYQSISGTVISVLTIISCFTISMLFGNEIYEKKNPIVSISQEFTTYSDIHLEYFPFMVTVTSPDKHSFSKEDLRNYVHLEIASDVMSVDGTITRGNQYFDFELCDPNKFKNQRDRESISKYLKEKSTSNYFCVVYDKNTMFSNSYYSNNSTNINFYVKKCLTKEMIDARIKTPSEYEYLKSSNSTIQELRTQRVCPSDMPLKVQDAQFTVVYINSIANFNNFDQPISTSIEEATTLISLHLLRRVYMRFTYNKFITDVGILLEEKVVNNFINLFSVVPDDLLLNKEGLDKEILIWLALESPKVSTIISRQYMKLQDLLAKVGGVINAIIIIMRILFYHYLRFLYIYEVKENALECINQKNLEKQIINGLEQSTGDQILLLSPKTMRNIEFFSKLHINQTNLANKENQTNVERYSTKNNQGKFHSSKEIAENLYVDKYRKVKLTNPEEESVESGNNSKNDNEDVENSSVNENVENSINSNNSPKLHDFKNCQISYDSEGRNQKSKINEATKIPGIEIKKITLKDDNSFTESNEDNSRRELEISKGLELNNKNTDTDSSKGNKTIESKKKMSLKIDKKLKIQIDQINDNDDKFSSIPEKSEEYRDEDSNNASVIKGDISYNPNSKIKTTYDESKLKGRKDSNINDLIKKLKEYNAVKGFFSPTVVQRLQNKNQRDIGYCNYLKSLLFCDNKILNEYELMYRAVKKILDFHTYCKMVVSQYNTTIDTKNIIHTEKM